MDSRLLRDITDEHVLNYEEDGVVVLRGAISMDWVERMRDAMDQVLDQPGPLGSDLNPPGTEGRFAFETFVVVGPREGATGRVGDGEPAKREPQGSLRRFPAKRVRVRPRSSW